MLPIELVSVNEGIPIDTRENSNEVKRKAENIYSTSSDVSIAIKLSLYNLNSSNIYIG